MRFIPTLLTTDDLGTVRRRASGYHSAAAAGALVRVRPGVFADEGEWTRARPEGRVIARARALTLTSADAPVISHESAAAMHGLPLFRPHPTHLHISLGEDRPGRALATIRHRARLRDDEVIEINGSRVTSLARTVADVARTADFEQAVVIADAALRRIGGARPAPEHPARAEEFRREVLTIAARSAHGFSRARRVMRFADGRAHLPGESISRIRLIELGFRRIVLQERVSAPDGRDYWVDFAVGGGEEAWLGEFDGGIKYTDPDILRGRAPRQVIDEEKQREDWIRGIRQCAFVRWGWSDIASPDALAARLRAFGIRPPA